MISRLLPAKWVTSFTPPPLLESLLTRRWFSPVLVFVLASLVMVPGLHLQGMQDWDESIYANVARGILRSGDLLHLTLGDKPYMNKPPLFMYTVALSMHLLGETDFAARLPAALFGAANVAIAFVLARRLFSEPTAWLTALLILSHRDFLSVSRHGRMESAVAFFIALGFLALLNAREGKRWLGLFALAVSAAILTKGPMGVIPVMLAVLLWALDRPLRQQVTVRQIGLCAAITAAISLPWFVHQSLSLGDAYIQRYIQQQSLDRVAMLIEGHPPRPIWYYLHVLSFDDDSAWGFMIPLLLVVAAFHVVWRRGSAVALLGLYALLLVGLPSLALETKLSHYAYAAHVPLAALAAWALLALPGHWARIRQVLVAVALLLVVGFQFSLRPKNIDLRNLVHSVKSDCRPQEPLIAIGMDTLALRWYTGRTPASLPDWTASPPADAPACWVSFTTNPPTQGARQWTEIARSGKFALWRSEPLSKP